MGHRYPQPDNEDGFEQLCLRYYRKLWSNENLKLYAKRGEKQDGIDIYDPLGRRPARAAQCKFHEPTKTLPPSEIKAEVAKAEKSPLKIEEYVIATTAKKSRGAQDTVAALNRRPKRKFTVDIHFWEDICLRVGEFGPIDAELIIYGVNFLAGAVVIAESGVCIAVSSSADIAGQSPGEPYATIEKLLDEHRLEAARHELDKVMAASANATFPSADRYKVLRLRGKLELKFANFESAGKFFLDAFAAAPELDQAKQNQVVAYSLLGNVEKAFALAKQYIAEGLATPLMVARLIDNAPTAEQLEEHSSLIKSHSATDDVVNTSLAHKYATLGDNENALKAAERALSIKSDSPQAHLVAAEVIHNASLRLDPQPRTEEIRRALSHYDAAERAARDQREFTLLPDVLVNRATARALIGDEPGAATDYREAAERAGNATGYVERAIGYFLNRLDFESAWELLEHVNRTTREGQYLALVAEHETAGETFHCAHIDQMLALANLDWNRAIGCRFHCVKWAVTLKDYQLAESCVPETFRQAHPLQAHTMLAWIRIESQEREGAKQEAAKALDGSIKSADPQELRLLARILVELEDDASALPLLDKIVTPGLFDDDMRRLINCAMRLERHDLLLRLCREVREAGSQDDKMRRLEMRLLSDYAPSQSLELADEFIERSATPWYFVAHKNFLLVKLKKLDSLNFDLSSLPTPAQLPPDEANLVALPYVVAGKHAEALKFLYDQMRLNFEDEHAHGRYIRFALKFGHVSSLKRLCPTVDRDTAALLELDDGEKRWVVIEDEQPAASRDEFASTSPLAQILVGRKVGDVVTLPGNELQPQSATIREIQTKYLRAFQDCLQKFVRRFPGTSILQQVNLGEEDQLDTSAVATSLKDRRAHVERVLELYRTEPSSLYLFATSVGVSEFEAITSLARHARGLIKCCQCTPEEFHRATTIGIATENIVLDITAIVTLTLVDGWRYLDKGKRYIASQLTSELLDDWLLDETEEGSQAAGAVHLDPTDNVVLFPVNDAEQAKKREQLRIMRAMVDEHCEIVSSLAMSTLKSETRKLYAEVLGIHNVEAMGVAQDRQATLWTDDLVLAVVGEANFGVKAVWTQLAMHCSTTASGLSMSDFQLITAKLAAWNYANIVWNPATLIAAGAVSLGA